MDPHEDEEDRAMSVGFDSDGEAASDGSEPADPPKPDDSPAGQQAEAPKAEADGQGPSGEAVVEDPFSGLPPQVRELLAKVPTLEGRIEEEKAARVRAEGLVRSVQGRLDRLTQSAPVSAPVSRTPKLDRALEELGSDMPEVTDALAELKALLPTEETRAAPSVEDLQQAPSGAAEIDPVQVAHIEALDSVRPDWFQTLESADCKLWLTQHPGMKSKYDAMQSAAQVLEVLGAFDEHRQALQKAANSAASRAARQAAAVTPAGSRRAPERAVPLSEEEAMARAFNT